MPFIRAKTQKNAKKLSWPERLPTSRTYYYLVESYRENGRVRQRTIAYLGRYSSVEDALTRLPKDIEERQKHLPWDCQQLDEAKTYYEAALGKGPAPEFAAKHSQFSPPRWKQWHNYKTRLQLPEARNNYRQAERHVALVQKHIAELEARLAKLQALSNPDGSAHEMADDGP